MSFACTGAVGNSKPLHFSIDADTVVRQDATRVVLVLEGQSRTARKDWEILKQQSYRPTMDSDWPWEIVLPAADSNFARYQLTALARDAGDSVVGRVQAVRELAQIRDHGLRVRFEQSCYRPKEPCKDQFTCSGGVCVNAADPAAAPAADGGTTAPPDATQPNVDQTRGIAAGGAACKADDRACAGQGSRKPLRCENGTWVAQPECLESERCSTASGPNRGECQPIADACANRTANQPYCEGDTMRVCVDLLESEVRACAENERCLSDGTSARCACRPGYVMEQTRCVPAKACGTTAGGCDPLTQCRMVNDQPVCGDCPEGYSGNGQQGCSPLLLGLTLSAGTLEPAFDPTLRDYRAQVPLLAPRVELTPTIPAKTTASLNGAAFQPKGLTPVLPLGKATPVELVVTSEFGVSSKYTITLERTGEEQSYIKSVNAGSYDQFGSSLAVAGNTLVVGSWFEDQGATDNGAAYVFEREADGWKMHAQLKPGDPSDYTYFGSSLDLDGDTIAVGAIRQGLFTMTSATPRQGAVYMFARSGSGWMPTQRLSAAKQDVADMFGLALALSGDTLVVSAPGESSVAKSSGAVYVYQRSGSMWIEVQKLKASKPAESANFGASVSLEGDRLVVGAPRFPTASSETGEAEAFVRRDGKWSSVQVLKPAELRARGCFGFTSALRGDRLAISAPHPSPYPGSPTSTDPGEVYVFELDGDLWKERARLQALHPRNTDWFGMSVLLTDGALVVGSPGNSSGARGLPADPARTDAPFSGAVHLFAPGPQGWNEAAFFKGSNTDENDWFAYTLATDGSALVVGALFENGTARSAGGGLTTGAVYVFH